MSAKHRLYIPRARRYADIIDSLPELRLEASDIVADDWSREDIVKRSVQ